MQEGFDMKASNRLSKGLFTLLVGGAAAFAVSMTPAQSASPVLSSSSNCVAYKTSKTLAMVSNQSVVGTNCNVSIKAVKAPNGNLSAEIQVPISGFDSNEHDRDVEVAKILQAGTQPNVIIRTIAMPAATWLGMLKKGGGPVKAQLIIGGHAHAISTNARIGRSGSQLVASGIIVTKFSAFGIKPPEVGPGGIIAKAPDYLELHYNLLSGNVQNLGVVPMK